jgi:hypothetical protein
MNSSSDDEAKAMLSRYYRVSSSTLFFFIPSVILTSISLTVYDVFQVYVSQNKPTEEDRNTGAFAGMTTTMSCCVFVCLILIYSFFSFVSQAGLSLCGALALESS